MSLRDQLLKAGLVDKKRARQHDQDEAAERKKGKGERERRGASEARAAEEAKREAEARQAALIASRREAERRQEAELLRRTVSNLLRQYKLLARPGNQPFWHRAADGLHVHKLMVNDRHAYDLWTGRLAIAWMGDEPDDPSYVLLTAEVAARVAAIEPSRVLFHNPTPAPRDDPAEALFEPG